MITELAVERVEFTCGHCWHPWSADYDVLHYRDEDGADWEYFSRDGNPVPAPYSVEGAPACPQCHSGHWVGHLAARRLVPLPSGDLGEPRSSVGDLASHRSERYGAPPLDAAAHHQPERRVAAAAHPAHADR